MGSGPSAPADGPKTLVVVGAGPGGAKLVSIILSKGWAGKLFNVVLIDRKDALHHNIAAVRAVAQPGWAERQFWPYDTFNKPAANKVKGADASTAFKFVQGSVTSITDKEVAVTPVGGGASTTIKFGECCAVLFRAPHGQRHVLTRVPRGCMRCCVAMLCCPGQMRAS